MAGDDGWPRTTSAQRRSWAPARSGNRAQRYRCAPRPGVEQFTDSPFLLLEFLAFGMDPTYRTAVP